MEKISHQSVTLVLGTVDPNNSRHVSYSYMVVDSDTKSPYQPVVKPDNAAPLYRFVEATQDAVLVLQSTI